MGGLLVGLVGWLVFCLFGYLFVCFFEDGVSRSVVFCFFLCVRVCRMCLVFSFFCAVCGFLVVLVFICGGFLGLLLPSLKAGIAFAAAAEEAFAW